MIKRVILGFLFVLSVVGGTTLVFGTDIVFSTEIKPHTNTSSNIYLGEKYLSQTVIGYKSSVDLRNAEITSQCNTDSTYLGRYQGIYYFSLNYIGESCNSGDIILEYNDEEITDTYLQLNIVSKPEIFNVLTDYSTSDIKNFYATLNGVIKNNLAYKDFQSSEIEKYISYQKRQRKYQEAVYQASIVESILEGRLKKYASPVPGKNLSRGLSKIPNAKRPYRQAYTDGIHHGWDIDGAFGDQVAALDDGVIIRIVDGFDSGDFSRIEYGENLSYEQKLKNLDVLRGNQIWLKTTKGEVVFYSHLEDIYDYVKEGDMISRGTPMGTIGVTGVPGEGYDDYHLHFAVQVNPYNKAKAGTYKFDDYMKWDWKFKGETVEYILENQTEIFQ